MIENLALKLAVIIKSANTEETHSIEVMKYSLAMLINILLVLFASIILGIISGKLFETLQAFTFFFIIRSVSGGYHMRTLVGCFIISTLAFVIIPHIPIRLFWVNVLTCVSGLLFLIYAPKSQEQNNIPSQFKSLLKSVSVVIVCSNILFESPIFALASLLQGILLIPGGEFHEQESC
ncbi:accessory gene regulator ArgB-like protein [Paenibacillus tianmuensis]|uniref:accessory gene regulator ArgB-like protein n=1 Tax=Paenibacillus tianmuensis TaxID=624147 RepID=UPI000B80BB3A|nr:accessory gene regulator B family protein [Paenibacillus tianmuensis]